METSKLCADIMHHYEGLKLEAYLCPAKVPTIGLGNTRYLNDRAVRMGDKITLQDAYALASATLKKFAQAVTQALKVPVTQYQFDALVCLTYNIGRGAFEAVLY